MGETEGRVPSRIGLCLSIEGGGGVKTIERQESGEQEQLVLLSRTQSRIGRGGGGVDLSLGGVVCPSLSRDPSALIHTFTRGGGAWGSLVDWHGKGR